MKLMCSVGISHEGILYKINPLKYVIRRTMMTSYEDADRNRKVIDSQVGEKIKAQIIIEELPKLLKDGIQYEATGEEYQLFLILRNIKQRYLMRINK